MTEIRKAHDLPQSQSEDIHSLLRADALEHSTKSLSGKGVKDCGVENKHIAGTDTGKA